MSYDHERDQFRGRIPPRIWDKERLEVFTDPATYSLEIRSMAVSLTEEQVLAYYNLEMGDLPPYDQFFFKIEFNRGRTVALQNAGHALMENMKGNKDAALAYLSRFGSDNWSNGPVIEPGKSVPLHVVIAEPQ